MQKVLTIDGHRIEADPSRTVFEKAQDLGISIPTLCNHKALTPYGVCRICVVEVVSKGRSSLKTACTYPAREGEVRTDSEKVRRARRSILELMLAEAPEAKEIQELAERYGADREKYKVSRAGKKNRCILCGLCVRVCGEVMKIGAIGFKNRGNRREIAVPFDTPSEVCSTCGACVSFCPTNAITLEDITAKKIEPILSEFDQGLGRRSAIYTPFPQALPKVPVIDKKSCMYFQNNACKMCASVCEPGAIHFDQEETVVQEDVGAIVVATGYEEMNPQVYTEYGGGTYPDVITGLQYERLISSTGPTGGELVRPSDGTVPKRIVFVQCVGSRDESKGHAYCSGICCMYTAKHAMLYKHHVPDGEAYVCYIDIRSPGKNYDEFIRRAIEEEDVRYLRGRVAGIRRLKNNRYRVFTEDTLAGRPVTIDADMVVLAAAVESRSDAEDLARVLGISYDSDGFYTEAHPKLKPVETASAGLFLAGACQGPKDIPSSVQQGSAAASKVLSLFARDMLKKSPKIASVDPTACTGCLTCGYVCHYSAIEELPFNGRKVSKIIPGKCQGCGACVATCKGNAISLAGFSDDELFEEIVV